MRDHKTPFPELLEISRRHREQHGCGAYPYDKAGLLVVVANAISALRVVEVGTALGYTAICVAKATAARIDTIDFDRDHVALATSHAVEYQVADRIKVHLGEADDELGKLEPAAYDLAFFDGFAPTASILDKLHRRLRPGGMCQPHSRRQRCKSAHRPLQVAQSFAR